MNTIDMMSQLIKEAQEKFGFSAVALFALVGSRAFNVHSEESDWDFAGAYIPNKRQMFGFSLTKNHQYEHSFGGQVSLYPIGEYVRLVMAQNPNLDFIPHITETNVYTLPMFRWLMNGNLFKNLAGASRSYYGYAQSQYNGAFERPKDAGEKRLKQWEKYGYVPKEMAHAIRILRTGTEFVNTGTMRVYRTDDADELRSIRKGEWSAEDVAAVFCSLRDNFPKSNVSNELADVVEECLIRSLTRFYRD